MLLLGIDLGTSSIKVSVVDALTTTCIASAQYPEVEEEIISIRPGWAEQSPDVWWKNVQLAVLKLHALHRYNPKDITAIGIAYQMHGLVMVDAAQASLRNSIIWCDSRAVAIGDKAFKDIGHEKCLSRLLNSPGNFTASKLAWVKENEPDLYEKIDRIMLPGDFIAMRLTGEITTSISALSEGIFWDYKRNQLSEDVLDYYQFDRGLIPSVKNVFAGHGNLTREVASTLSLNAGIPVTYKAGDQPNNALSLNVLQPGEVAATAGTSGVIYGVSEQLRYDKDCRINTFAHVNYTVEQKRLGVLLCINGTGIFNRWMKNIAGAGMGYDQMNNMATSIKPGSDGLMIFPFGNGAERMFNNKIIGAHLQYVDLNKHGTAHLFRATLEGIAFSFRRGLDIMRETGLHPKVIRAGNANMFLSSVFTKCFANALNVPVEMYTCDGSVGAALGAGLGAGIYKSETEAFQNLKPVQCVEPDQHHAYNMYYNKWLAQLEKIIQ